VGSAADKNPPIDTVFSSRMVPNQLLGKRDLLSIAESVLLESGEKICVDAHGIGFTAAELAAMDSCKDFSEIGWVTAKPPKLAPFPALTLLRPRPSPRPIQDAPSNPLLDLLEGGF